MDRIAHSNGGIEMNNTTNRLTLTVEEAAQVIGISRAKAYQLVRSAGFPTIKIGRRLLVSAKGLDAWLDKQAEEGWSA